MGAFTELLWLELVTENSRGEMKNQQGIKGSGHRLSNNVNSLMFNTVQNFIAQSGRFAIE